MTSPAAPARLTPARAVGWILAFGLVGIALTALCYAVYFLLAHGSLVLAADPKRPTLELVVVSGMTGTLGFAGATWIVAVRRLGLSWRDLRWSMPNRGRGLLLGFVLGGAAAAMAMLLAVPAGGARWLPDHGTVVDYGVSVVRTAVVLAPAALNEEIVFRGVPLVLLAAFIGRFPAFLALSVLFAVAHQFNPNVTPVGLANVALAGVWLSLAFYAPGGIWTAFGTHLGWNATLAALDAPVSGLPFRIPFIDYHAGGPSWLTGGSFGPEGGLTATIALTLAIVVAWRWTRKDVTAT